MRRTFGNLFSFRPAQRKITNRLAKPISRLRRSLSLSLLEDRSVPAIYTVNDPGDAGLGVGLVGDLRYCVTTANASIGVADVINFDNATMAGQIVTVATQLDITDELAINGPTLVAGKPNCAVDGADLVRVFNVNMTTGSIQTFSLSKLTVSNGLGAVTTGSAGAVLMSSVEDTFNFTDCVFDSNTGANYGGAIGALEPTGVDYGIVNVTRCTFSNNTNQPNFGGALALNTDINGNILGGWTSTITDTTFDTNTNTRNGGALFFRGYFADVKIINTTFVNNALTTTGFGGAISNLSGSGVKSSTFAFTNCTFSGNNNADVAGAGGVMASGGGSTPIVSFNNCTFALNTAAGNGNVYAASSGAPVVTFTNCIMNNNVGGNMISGAISPTIKYSITPDKAVMGPFTDGGNNQFNTDALLGPLGITIGGNTAYHVPGAGSTARNTGLTIAGLTTDQRGSPRPLGAKYDIGSIESSDPTPTASAVAGDVLAPSGAKYQFTVTYNDDIAVKVGTINKGDVKVDGPFGFTVVPDFVMASPNADSATIVATYEFVPPVNSAAGWDFSDNGAYTITMNATQVGDGVLFVNAGTLTVFNAAIPQTFTVDTLGDAGVGVGNKGDIRYVIDKANLALGAIDNIVFDPSVQGKTLLLASEIAITEAVNIVGPTSGGAVTISGGGATRVFNVAGVSIFTVTLSNVTITDGNSFAGGGAIVITDEKVVANNVIFTKNTAATNGGVVEVTALGGRFEATDSTFTLNTAVGKGGVAATTNVNGFIVMTRCVADGNTAANGGVISIDLGGMNISQCLFTNNSGTTDGGAISLTQVLAGLTISNSTISGNIAPLGAGILDNHQGSTLNIRNSTIFDAINHVGTVTQAGNVSIVSSIVQSIDIAVAGVVAEYSFSILNSATGAGTYTDKGNNVAIGTDPGMGALANNGGTSKTHGLLPGSPALGAGTNPDGLTFDQRGSAKFPSFVRTVSTATDIGAFEGTLPIPGGVLTPLGPIVTAGPTPDSVTVTYSNPGGGLIQGASIDVGDIEIRDPLNNKLAITKITPAAPGDASPLAITYTFSVPVNGAAGWDYSDFGKYTVSLLAGQITDTNSLTNVAQSLGSFQVTIPVASLLVDEVSDLNDGNYAVGKLSLREAIVLSNGGVSSVINFSGAKFGSAQTITMASEMAVTAGVTINGPTAKLTLDANNASRILNINSPTVGAQITISNLAFTKGNVTGDGGSFLVQDEKVTLSKVSVSSSTATAFGGGISFAIAGGSLTMTDSTISLNKVTGAAGYGGGLEFRANTAVVIQNSTISGNISGKDGGGISFYNQGSLQLSNSSVVGNKADTVTSYFGGGGLYFFGAATGPGVVISGSTFSGNDSGSAGTAQAFAGGGAISIVNAGTGVLLISNTTITGNTANTGAGAGRGGAIMARNMGANFVTIRNSTITKNDAGFGGGGFAIAATGAQVFSSSIIAQNTVGGSATAPTADLLSNAALNVSGNNNLIGVQDAATLITLTGTGNLTGTAATPLDAKLGALASNGGPTQTHALLAGSPAINAGNNTAGLSFDQRDTGFNRVGGSQADIGAFEIQTVTKVVTGSILINSGQVGIQQTQRSRVTDVRIPFDSKVTFVGGDSNAAAAFTLNQIVSKSGFPVVLNPVTLAASVDNSGPGTVVTLTFTGGAVDNISLADGRYALHGLAAQFVSGLDGNGDGTGGDDFMFDQAPIPTTPIPTPGEGPLDITKIFRLFGDVTNAAGTGPADGTVALQDFIQFRLANGGVSFMFDFDNNGGVGLQDFINFRLRNGSTI